MKAEEFFKEYLEFSGAGNVDFELAEVMRKYAKQKCKELLEIIAEKAEATIMYDGEYASVDKDSILNAVDLDKFCS